jgi:hypothetical protein
MGSSAEIFALIALAAVAWLITRRRRGHAKVMPSTIQPPMPTARPTIPAYQPANAATPPGASPLDTEAPAALPDAAKASPGNRHPTSPRLTTAAPRVTAPEMQPQQHRSDSPAFIPPEPATDESANGPVRPAPEQTRAASEPFESAATPFAPTHAQPVHPVANQVEPPLHLAHVPQKNLPKVPLPTEKPTEQPGQPIDTLGAKTQPGPVRAADSAAALEPPPLNAEPAPLPEQPDAQEPASPARQESSPPPPERRTEAPSTSAEHRIESAQDAQAHQLLHTTSPGKQERKAEQESQEDQEAVDGTRTTPGKYRPPSIPKPSQPRKQEQKANKPAETQKAERQKPLEVRLQALFDQHGFCTFRLLAPRPKNSKPEQAVNCAGAPMELIESTDEWYEIAEPPPLGPALADGILLVEHGRAASKTLWELKGRPLYILTSHHGLAGFVNATRLCIGREQVVLCKEEMAEQVQAVLAISGCKITNRHRQDHGAPEGWVFFKPAKPVESVQHILGEEMLNLLRPLPDIELALEGGLWIENSSWMEGFPPQILVSGELPEHAVVQIDGRPAEKRPDGTFCTAASDAPGPHSVCCEGRTCSYTIVQPSTGWDTWEPLSFGSATICGAKVSAPISSGCHYTKVPTANPILVGANPGEIFQCESRPAGFWSGYVPFKAVWALPENPLRSKRDASRILLLSVAPPCTIPPHKPGRNFQQDPARRWCRAILDCRRKKLTTEPSNGEALQLWTLYTRHARNLARKLKHHDT